MQKRDGKGETKAHTKSGTEEGEEMQKINREDVVQAALTIERWCAEQSCGNCPFGFYKAWRLGCAVSMKGDPKTWNLEKFLRTRGLKHD